MAKLCAEDNIAMTPYSALAGGRLSKHPGETSKRLEEDSYAKFKYDATAEQDCSHYPTGGRAGGKTGRIHDGDFFGVAAHQGDRPGSGRHQAAPYRRGGQSQRSSP